MLQNRPLVAVALLGAALAYLIAVPTAQIFLLGYCFDASIAPSSALTIYGAAILLGGGFGIGLLRPTAESTRPAIPSNGLTWIAGLLVIASILYVAVAVYRIDARWDSFSLGPSAARFDLIRTRKEVTTSGLLNAVFIGAPATLVLFVTIFDGRVRHKTIFRAAAVLAFGAFFYLTALEGGRSPYLLTILMTVSAITFHLLRGEKLKDLGRLFLLSLIATSILSFYVAYREAGSREAETGRTTVEATEKNYSAYLEGQPTSRPKSISSTVGCFYAAHTPKSIDKIVAKNADRNLFGFYMMPNYFKLAATLGIFEDSWISYSDYYDITGLYVGLTGALLIDFSWAGILMAGVIGFLIGKLVNIALSKNGANSPFYPLATIAPIALALAPLTDMISMAQFQSMTPWLLLVTITLVVLSARERRRHRGVAGVAANAST
ncbi:hypothetical protein ACFIOY_35065 [Bradyrhizobium sp. TZ2]